MAIISKINPFPRKNFISYSSINLEHKEQVARLYLFNKFISNNYKLKIDNCKVARDLNGKYTIKDILSNCWDDFSFIFRHKITRPAINDNVQKLIACKDITKGYIFFECPNCDNYHLQGLSCHSRFCSSCGKKYSDARTISVASKIINVPHRHVVCTVPKELRHYFRRDRNLIDILFNSVKDMFSYIAFRMGKRKQYRFGYVAVLHTFGRDLKFIPHLHIVLAEGVYDKDNNFKKVPYIEFKLLRKTFQRCLLANMLSYIGASFKDQVNESYKLHKKGFYVYAPKIQAKSFKDGANGLIKYVVRYTNHPAISESRILNVDYDKYTITYYYDPHEDDLEEDEEKKLGRQYVTEGINDFIAKLIVHIPDNKKHVIRYFGFYSNASTVNLSNKKKLFTKKEISEMRKFLLWRYRLYKSYGYDPILCECGHKMVVNLNLSYFPSERITI